MEALLRAIEYSDPAGAKDAFDGEIHGGGYAWDIHSALFPLAQRVLNPPFINPHLPKMHAICREFLPYLEEEDLPALVRLEVCEYARRPLLEPLPRAAPAPSSGKFGAIESAVGEQDRMATTQAMAGFLEREGGPELARRLVLLGSGYPGQTLGHSISCTVFILQEMFERADLDPWLVLENLADYFCKGKFRQTPEVRATDAPAGEEALREQVLRSVTGSGVVDLHHTITLYAVERTRSWLSRKEQVHLLGTWVRFMKDKKADPVALRGSGAHALPDYAAFWGLFSGGDASAVVEEVAGMLDSPAHRRRLGRFLIKGVCDSYQGNYDPHFLTGLGSLLWAMERFAGEVTIVHNALLQYLRYFFAGLHRGQ